MSEYGTCRLPRLSVGELLGLAALAGIVTATALRWMACSPLLMQHEWSELHERATCPRRADGNCREVSIILQSVEALGEM